MRPPALIATRLVSALLSLGVVLALLGATPAWGQRQSYLDSLKAELRSNLPDTLRAQVLFQLGYELRRSLPDSSLACARQVMALSALAGYDRGRALAYRLLAAHAYVKGDFPKALSDSYKALGIFQQIGDERGVATASYTIGSVFQRLGFLEQALEYFGRSVSVFQKYGMATEYASVLNNLGETLLQKKVYDGARMNFRQSMAIFERLGEAQFVAENRRNLGEVSLALGQLDSAERYFSEAYSEFARLNNEVGIVATRLNLATLGLRRGKPDEAVFQAGAAMQVAEARGMRDRILLAQDILAQAQARRGFWREAYAHQRRFKELTDSVQGAESAKQVALMEAEGNERMQRAEIDLLTKQTQLDRAVFWGLGAILLLVLALAGVVWRTNRRQKRANQLLQERADEIERQRAALSTRADELRAANARVSAESEARDQANQELKATLEHLRDTQEQLILSEKMASLGRLVANVAHELNTPLGVIQSSGSHLKRRVPDLLQQHSQRLATLGAEGRAWFEQLVERGSRRSPESLSAREERQRRGELQQLLEAKGWTHAEEAARGLIRVGIVQAEELPPAPEAVAAAQRLEIIALAATVNEVGGTMGLIATSTDKMRRIVQALRLFATDTRADYGPGVEVIETIERALGTYSNYLREGVKLEVLLSERTSIFGHPDELTQVWGNLLLNAIQAVAGQGHIRVSAEVNRDSVMVTVADTGAGIPQAVQARLFEPFFTTKPRGEGSGLGLYISKKIIENHGGSIRVSSKAGDTQVTVRLPLQPPPSLVELRQHKRDQLPTPQAVGV